MRLTYFGHSCFLLDVGGARLVLDPYLKDNPHGRVALASVPCDYILCTHAHEDHICDAVELSKLHGATIVAPYELAEHFDGRNAKALDLMPGGGVNLPWGRVDMTHAVHSSALELPGGKNRYMGSACGYVVRAGGKSVYHAGDTALFGDMSFIGRGGLDAALVPIGDRYTMGPADAVESLNLLRPKLAVPMHYDTTDKIRQNPHAFAKSALATGHTVRVMGAGETIEV
jgi:L-ascorbate metabolism protein UlaG (beta-lactamase superfamily)